MTVPNPFKRSSPPPVVVQKHKPKSKQDSDSGPPPPREPRLRPLFTRETTLLNQTRAKLAEAEEMHAPALERLEEARKARLEQMAQRPASSLLPTDAEEAEVEEVDRLIEDWTAAVGVAEDQLEQAKARGPTDQQLCDFEDRTRAVILRTQTWCAAGPVVAADLAAVRAEGRRIYGNGSEVNSLPTEMLEQAARKVEPLVDAPAFGRILDRLDGVVRERRRRAGPPKTERDFGLEGGKGELPPVEVEAVPEAEPTQDAPPAQSPRPEPGQPAIDKPPPTGPPKPKPGFGLLGGKTKRTD